MTEEINRISGNGMEETPLNCMKGLRCQNVVNSKLVHNIVSKKYPNNQINGNEKRVHRETVFNCQSSYEKAIQEMICNERKPNKKSNRINVDFGSSLHGFETDKERLSKIHLPGNQRTSNSINQINYEKVVDSKSEHYEQTYIISDDTSVIINGEEAQTSDYAQHCVSTKRLPIQCNSCETFDYKDSLRSDIIHLDQVNNPEIYTSVDSINTNNSSNNTLEREQHEANVNHAVKANPNRKTANEPRQTKLSIIRKAIASSNAAVFDNIRPETEKNKRKRLDDLKKKMCWKNIEHKDTPVKKSGNYVSKIAVRQTVTSHRRSSMRSATVFKQERKIADQEAYCNSICESKPKSDDNKLIDYNGIDGQKDGLNMRKKNVDSNLSNKISNYNMIDTRNENYCNLSKKPILKDNDIADKKEEIFKENEKLDKLGLKHKISMVDNCEGNYKTDFEIIKEKYQHKENILETKNENTINFIFKKANDIKKDYLMMNMCSKNIEMNERNENNRGRVNRKLHIKKKEPHKYNLDNSREYIEASNYLPQDYINSSIDFEPNLSKINTTKDSIIPFSQGNPEYNKSKTPRSLKLKNDAFEKGDGLNIDSLSFLNTSAEMSYVISELSDASFTSLIRFQKTQIMKKLKRKTLPSYSEAIKNKSGYLHDAPPEYNSIKYLTKKFIESKQQKDSHRELKQSTSRSIGIQVRLIGNALGDIYEMKTNVIDEPMKGIHLVNENNRKKKIETLI